VSFRTVALALLIALIGGAALAFGSVEDWSESWLRVGLLLTAAALVASGAKPRSLRGATGALLAPIVALVAFGLFQSMPVPDAAVAVLSPHWSRLRAEVVPQGDADALLRSLQARAVAKGASIQPGAEAPVASAIVPAAHGVRALSVAPGSTRRSVLGWITAVLGLACAAVLARRSADLYALLWALAAWSGVLGAIAVVTQVSGTTSLMGLRPAPPDTRVLGPFVNRDHFATFVEIGILVGFGLLFALLSDADGHVTRASIRTALFDRQWALPRVLALSGCLFLGLVGLVLTRSRAGTLAFGIGFLSLLALRRLKGRIVVLVIAIVLVGLAVGLVSWAGGHDDTHATGLSSSALSDSSFALRWQIWGRTLRVIRDYPWVGSGLGSFRYVYAGYDRPGEWMATEQAHNDYLELIAGAGLVGALLLAWAVIAFLGRVVLPIAKAAPLRWTTAGCLSAVLAILIHSVFDFGLQIPAVALEFAVTLGLLTAIASGIADRDPETDE
jgi:putative inorganic carbon (hco3(-)) transporter